MKKLILITALLFFPALSYAGDWNSINTALEVSNAAALTIDWGQTRFMARNHDQLCLEEQGVAVGNISCHSFTENNPFLGKHPSLGRVDAWFMAWEVLHPVISYLIPNPYRYFWQSVTLTAEVTSIKRNYGLGIGFKF